MPATPSRIGFITNEWRRAIAGPNADIEAQFGEAARDTPEPIETFFVNTADAQAMANERLALLGAKRRFVEVDVADDSVPFDLDFTDTLATAQVVDDELAIDRAMLVVSINVDLSTERVTLDAWG